MKSVVSEKGQVTIPKALRDRLGLKPGTQLEFSAANGHLVGRKVDSPKDPVEEVTGIVECFDVDRYLRATRGRVE